MYVTGLSAKPQIAHKDVAARSRIYRVGSLLSGSCFVSKYLGRAAMPRRVVWLSYLASIGEAIDRSNQAQYSREDI